MKSRPEKGNAPEVAATEASSVKNQRINQGINMSNSTEVQSSRAITVPFHGAELYVVEHNGLPYTPMKPIAEGMGLAWQPQHRKLSSNDARWGITMMVIPAQQGVTLKEIPSGGSQQMLMMPLRKLPGWLATIDSGRIKNLDVRARVIQYQNECDDALWQYWNEGVALNHRAFSVHSDQTLAAEQADELRHLVERWARRLSHDTKTQGKFIMQAWSKLKSHYKVSYRQIPQASLHEAISIIARHAAAWEVVDEAPKPSALPRLQLRHLPPAPSTYRFDPANPYPATGRTIEVAKCIVADIRIWSDNLPGSARQDLYEAAQVLNDLLVSGWTEVDEALGQMHTAMHMLNRWQGRGGRAGNTR